MAMSVSFGQYMYGALKVFSHNRSLILGTKMLLETMVSRKLVVGNTSHDDSVMDDVTPVQP
jgi:hypothetical protein